MTQIFDINNKEVKVGDVVAYKEMTNDGRSSWNFAKIFKIFKNEALTLEHMECDTKRINNSATYVCENVVPKIFTKKIEISEEYELYRDLEGSKDMTKIIKKRGKEGGNGIYRMYGQDYQISLYDENTIYMNSFCY
jgi:hypothetical protein